MATRFLGDTIFAEGVIRLRVLPASPYQIAWSHLCADVDQLRRPFLLITVALIALTVLLCLGSSLVTGPPPYGQRVSITLADPQVRALLAEHNIDPDDAEDELNTAPGEDPPGLAIPTLALINGLLLLIMILTSLPLLVGDRATGTVQGVISIIGGLIGLIAGVVAAIVAFTAMLLMVSLLLAVPFGTLAYLATFGSFDTSGAGAITAMMIMLQVIAFVCLILAQQRFLASRGLVLLFATALLLTVVTGLLHSLVPSILVSITDALGALIIGIVGAIWSLVILIGGIIGAVRLLQLGKHTGGPATTRSSPQT